jgi:hypothetical protein
LAPETFVISAIALVSEGDAISLDEFLIGYETKIETGFRVSDATRASAIDLPPFEIA